MSNKKKALVDAGTYPFNVVVYVGYTSDETIKDMSEAVDLNDQEKESIESITEQTRARVIRLSSGQMVLWLRKIPRKPKDLATFSHECVHLTQFLFDLIGQGYSEDSHEAWAYQHEYFFYQILTALHE